MKSNMYIEKCRKIFEQACTYISGLLNKKATVKIGGRKQTLHPFKIAVSTVAVIVVLSLILSIFSLFGGHKTLNVTFEGGNEYKTKPFKDNVIMYNNRGVWAINSGGETEWEIKETLSEPFVEAKGSYILLADLAGKHFAAIYKNGKPYREIKTENDIISAKVTGRGYSVFATDTDGYKGKVAVYNRHGNQIYEWYSGSGYITDVELTENGRYLAVAQLISDGEVANTKVQFIDTRHDQVVATAERTGEIAVCLKAVARDRLVVLTDKGISGYNMQGKEKFHISLIGKSPTLYNLDGDNTIGVVTQGGRGNSVLELYSTTGKLRGAYTATGDIRALSVRGKSAVVAQQKGLTRISSRGKEKKIISISHDVKSIGCFDGDKKVLAIGSGEAEVIKIK